MSRKRILAASDLHAGHLVGLTPPGWWSPDNTEIGKIQRELWIWWETSLQSFGPFDAALWLGDLIDGSGRRSGGTECITTDRLEQCQIAASCIKAVPMCEGGKHVTVKGTPYHVGDEEDFEDVVASLVGNMTIGGHEWAEVNGVVFDLKHKTGGSQVPHGRHTAIARERLWNVLWSERDYAPRADIILRGHVHYHNFCGGSDWLAMTMPALQGPGSKYGVRQCSGTIDVGFITFDIDEEGSYAWTPHLLRLQAGKPEAVKL